MARIARVVAPGLPHHITQRGNRKQKTFFGDDDYRAYKSLITEWFTRHKVEAWAYCLMPNHVHFIVVPETEDGLRRAIGEAHRRYTRMVSPESRCALDRVGWRAFLPPGKVLI